MQKPNRKLLNTNTLFIIFFLILPLFSCLPKVKKEVVKYEPIVTYPQVLSPEMIDKKISVLDEFLKKDDILPEEKEDAQSLLSDYRKIKSILKQGMSEQDYRDIIRILFQNMDRIDDKYLLSKRELEDEKLMTAVNELSLKKQKIQEKYLSGDFQGVITGCIELETTFGPNSLSPDVGIIFAMSLAKINKLKEAVDMGEMIARELEGKPGLIDLRAGIIEWLIALGNKEKALEVYEKLIDDINEKSALFSRIQRNIAPDKEDIEHPGDFAPDDYLSELSQLAETERSRDLLNEVDRLVREKNYTEARLILLRWRLRVEEGTEEEIIEKALNAVAVAEKGHNAGGPVETEEEPLGNAERLIEEERYEDAIKTLEILEESHSDNKEINRLKTLAIEKIIESERNKAARIFQQSKNIDDPGRKEELLMNAFKILNELIEKYPLSASINKVYNNLDTVRDEIETLHE